MHESYFFAVMLVTNVPWHEISNNQQSLRSACAYAQSDQSLCSSLEYSMIVKLPTKHYLEFLSLKGGCRGPSEFKHVKMPHCWKSHAAAQMHCIFCDLVKANTSVIPVDTMTKLKKINVNEQRVATK